MLDAKSTHKELADAIKAKKDADAKVEELLKVTRAEDLKTVKDMIVLHKFTQTELKSAFKTRAVKKTGEKRPYKKKAKPEVNQ